MQIFYINQHSTLNTLRIELINDAKYEFLHTSVFNDAIQNADITFSMWDDRGVLKISNAPCNLILTDEGSCEEKYVIEYKWKPRDVKCKGQYVGKFKITFKEDLENENGVVYPVGDLIVPVYEDLIIMIK